jgi:hypothetical protein
MKKKLALLLALAMIISILPMNVFGTTFTVPGIAPLGSTTNASHYLGAGPNSGFKFGYHAAWWNAIDIMKYVHDVEILVGLTRWEATANVDGAGSPNAAMQVTTGTTVSSLTLNVVLTNATFASPSRWYEYSGNSNGGDAAARNIPLTNTVYFGQGVAGATVSPATALQYRFDQQNTMPGTHGVLNIVGTGEDFREALTNNAKKFVAVRLYIHQTGENPPIITFSNSVSGSEQFNVPGSVHTQRNLRVSVHEPVASETFLHFSELRIAEGRRGDFNFGVNTSAGDVTLTRITMRTPSGWRWLTPVNRLSTGNWHGNDLYGTLFHKPADWAAIEQGWYNHEFLHRGAWPQGLMPIDAGSSGVYGWGTFPYSLANWVSNDGRYLVIQFMDFDDNLNALAERMALKGISMVADNRADFGNVNVQFAVDWWDMDGDPENYGLEAIVPVLGSVAGQFLGSSLSEVWGSGDIVRAGVGTQPIYPGLPVATPIITSASEYLWGSFQAGTRVVTEGEFVLEGDLPSLRSGDQAPGNVDVFLTQDDGAWTGWVRLVENAVGAWGGGIGFDATFSVPDHGGAVIMGAEVRFSPGTYPYATGSASQRYNFYSQVGTNELGSWNFPDQHGVLRTPHYVRVNPPLQNFTERTQLRNIDVRFQVSLEPGYEHKHGEELVITVSGPSTQLIFGEKEVVAAIVRDPITLFMDTTDVTISNNNAYNVAVRDIEPIIITETGFGALNKGDELWIYVTGARANEVEFTADFVADVNTEDSGLRLTRGSVLRHRWSNSWVNGIRYTVEERSFDRPSRPNNAPGEIAIVGGKITGPVYPGVEYEIVVSGNAVAANQYSVFENHRFSVTSGGITPGNELMLSTFDIARRVSWRLFDTEPYSAPAFEYDVDGSAPPPVEVEVIMPPASIGASLTLNEWSPAINGVKPFVMVQVDELTKVGMVSPRVIAEFFGGSVDWDAGSGTATITGMGKDGAVEVTLQAGATTGTINGQSHDIATYSNSAAAGLVSVYTSESNNFYVPMRFITNAFGYTIDWNPATATATIRN